MGDKARAELGFGGVWRLWAHFDGIVRQIQTQLALPVLLVPRWSLFSSGCHGCPARRGGLQAPQGRQVHAVCSNTEELHSSSILGGGPEDGRSASTGLSQGITGRHLLPGQLVSSPRVHSSLSEGSPWGHTAVSTCGWMLICADISHGAVNMSCFWVPCSLN